MVIRKGLENSSMEFIIITWWKKVVFYVRAHNEVWATTPVFVDANIFVLGKNLIADFRDSHPIPSFSVHMALTAFLAFLFHCYLEFGVTVSTTMVLFSTEKSKICYTYTWQVFLTCFYNWFKMTCAQVCIFGKHKIVDASVGHYAHSQSRYWRCTDGHKTSSVLNIMTTSHTKVMLY